MNSAILACQLVSPFDYKTSEYQGNSGTTASALVSFPALKEGDPPFTIVVSTWSGEKVRDTGIRPGQCLILEGNIRLDKDKPPGLVFSRFTPVETLLKTNLVHIVGRTGRDTEVKYFESGACKATNSLAVNRRKKGETDWFNIEFWSKTAEVAGNYVNKGTLIGVTGEIAIERWTDRDSGNPREKLVIKGTQLDLLGSKADRQEQQQQRDDGW